MAVYTKKGDKGETFLFKGKKVLKSDLQVEAYGNLDELASFLGLAMGRLKEEKDKDVLRGIQKDLQKIMAILAGAGKEINDFDLEEKVLNFEKYIDNLEAQLPKIHRFILPEGNEESVWFHIIRTISRRAERAVVRFFSCQLPVTSYQLPVLKYLNRLSDLFFVLARKYTHLTQVCSPKGRKS